MRSMTGFGRGEANNSELAISAEISGLNRKQAEVVTQVPRGLAAAFEPKIRKLVLNSVSRGRVQVSLKLNQAADQGATPQIDKPKAKAFFESIRELESLRGSNITLRLEDLSSFFLIAESELDADDAWPLCEAAIVSALESFLNMRASEGEHLLADTKTRLSQLAKLVDQLESRAPEVTRRYREMLHQRLAEAEIEVPLEDERLVREIGIFAERSDITEEITRLRSHLAKFDDYLASDEPIGRSLDFLCQETHREFNTIGSKANDAELAQTVVSAKTELEKLREQIQNVE